MDNALARAVSEAVALQVDLDPLLVFTKDLNAFDAVDYWVVQVPVGILYEAWRIQSELPTATKQENVPTLAFLCRNALELHVWARYAASSADAAKRFHQDAYIDGLEVFRLLDKVFQALDAEWHPLIKAAADPLMPEFQRVLKRDKVGLSIPELSAMKHLNIAQIAAQVGYDQVFTLWNPILSKLVHATAYNILVAGKTMERIGLSLVQGVARELRCTVTFINEYLKSNGMPLYHRR
jgi:hypothetical protein